MTRPARLYYVAAIAFLVVSVFSFIAGNTAIGATFVALGAAFIAIAGGKAKSAAQDNGAH